MIDNVIIYYIILSMTATKFDKHFQFVLKTAKPQQSTTKPSQQYNQQLKSIHIHIQSLNNKIFYQYDYANIRKDINW